MNTSQLVPLETVFKDLQRYLQWSLRILSRILNKALKWYYCQDRQRSVNIFNILVKVFEDLVFLMLVFLRAFKDLQRFCKDLANLGGSLPINIFPLQYDIVQFQNFADCGDSLKPKRFIEIVIYKKITAGFNW